MTLAVKAAHIALTLRVYADWIAAAVKKIVKFFVTASACRGVQRRSRWRQAAEASL